MTPSQSKSSALRYFPVGTAMVGAAPNRIAAAIGRTDAISASIDVFFGRFALDSPSRRAPPPRRADRSIQNLNDARTAFAPR